MKARIICLCGSTRFFKLYQYMRWRLTQLEWIVLTIGCDTKPNGDIDYRLSPQAREAAMRRAIELHKQKIALADAIYVIDPGGYRGESTLAEIEYAQSLGKQIVYLSEELPELATEYLRDQAAGLVETLEEYETAAMRTANSNPLAATADQQLLNAALGSGGEAGEVADHITTDDPLVNTALKVGAASGRVLDRLKKSIYHGKNDEDWRDKMREDLTAIEQSAAEAKAVLAGWQPPVPPLQVAVNTEQVEGLAKEWGDVLWYVVLGCKALDVSLQQVAQLNVDKLRRRYPEGFKPGLSVQPKAASCTDDQRWQLHSGQSASGKMLFRCGDCGRISQTPDKSC